MSTGNTRSVINSLIDIGIMFDIYWTKKVKDHTFEMLLKKYECNFDHLFSPYFLPYVYNTEMLPVGSCISWVNDYTNEY